MIIKINNVSVDDYQITIDFSEYLVGEDKVPGKIISMEMDRESLHNVLLCLQQGLEVGYARTYSLQLPIMKGGSYQ